MRRGKLKGDLLGGIRVSNTRGSRAGEGMAVAAASKERDEP